jgi:hypothetical protein
MLMADGSHGAPGMMDDRFVSEFERGVQTKGVGKPESGKFIEVGGLKAYERSGHATIKGRNVSQIMLVVPANGKVYCITAMQFNGEASDDAGIRNVLTSFRFLHPPVPPTRTRSAAYQTGYWFGRLGGLLALPVLVFFIIRQSRQSRRNSSSPPPVPPPPPPLP